MGRTLDPYLVSIYTGVAIGTGAIFALSIQRPVSVPLMTALVALVAVLSFALFKSPNIVGRSHPLLNWAKKGVYHFQIVALIFTVAALELSGNPVLPYLDIMVVGMILYQAFGRVGCLMAGCCHGRPCSWGVRYGKKHAETGYFYFVQGARLFPIQLIEALWLAGLAVGSIVIFLNDGQAGATVTWYIIWYGAGRFIFEFLRGDTGRIFAGGFSEPQWTAVLLSTGVVSLELAGVLPFQWEDVGVLGGMIAIVLTLSSAAFLGGNTVEELLRNTDARRVERTIEQVLLEANLVPLGPSSQDDPEGAFNGIYLPNR